MSQVNLTSVTVDDEKFDVLVDTDGEFICDVHGARVKAETLAALKPKIAGHARAFTKVQLPATVVELAPALCFVDVVITGKQAAGNNVLYARTVPGGLGPTRQSRCGTKFYTRLSSVQRALIERMYKRKQAAEEAYDACLASLEINTEGGGVVKAFNKLQRENAAVDKAVKASGAKKRK